MKKFIILLFIILFSPGYLFSQGTQIQHIDFLVKNKANNDYQGVIWINAEDIYSLLPEFDGFSFIVTTTHSPDIAADLKKKETDELESQPYDENRDGKTDRIGVYMSLKASERKVITVHTGEYDRILRIKGQYVKSCDAIQSGEGIFIESDKVAYRYDTVLNVFSIFGKMTHRNILDLITEPYYDRTKRTSIGEELFITKKAPGFGKLGVLREGEILGLSGNMPDNMYISGKGPLVSGINISSTYGTDVKVNSQFTIVRGSRWTLADVTLSGNWSGHQFITGIPNRSNEKILTGDDYIAAFAGMPSLGLAVYVPVEYVQDIRGHNGYHLIYLKPDETGHIKYAFSGHWELEHDENVVEQGESYIKLPKASKPWRERYKRIGKVLLKPQSRLDSIDKFENQINEDLTSIIRNQPIVERISEKAVTYTELYPPEAVRKNPKKSYHEALNLMISRLRMFAEEGLAIEGEERYWFTSDSAGEPDFFEPKQLTWGDGYWVSMLWDAYKVTNDPVFKKWALQYNKAMLGYEDKETINMGVNYWNGSARSYDETKDNIWKESAIKCADSWLRYADPVTGFVPKHGPNFMDKEGTGYPQENVSIIDVMMCLPVVMWAYKETSDKKYLDLALRHSDISMNTLIEPDGGVHQRVYYSPETGKILGFGTSQGSGGSSIWARAQAWALDGFADVYIFTRKQRHSDIFRLCTEWLMENLPADFVPWYDFDDQGIFYRFRDAGTSAICAHALLRMANVEKDSNLARWYSDCAVEIIDSLIDNYLTKVGQDDERPPGMLSHGCYTKVISDTEEQIWGSYNLQKALILLIEKGIQRK